MRVLFDIVHPAHAHFYRHMWGSLTEAGHEALVVSRPKDVTEDLLDQFGIPHHLIGSGPRRSWVGQGTELAARDAALVRLGRRFRPDIVLTRNPAGVHAARLLRVPGVFDTDNGRSAGIHFHLAAPAATVITTPTGTGEHYGPRHREYPSYKALAFLHPDRFTPDPTVRERLGVEADEPYYVLRFVAMDASHDHGVTGLSLGTARRAVDVLSRRGAVFVSAEGGLAADIGARPIPTPAADFHSVLAEADICIGDSGSVAAEAALLGTASVFYSSFAGRLSYLDELADRYHLAANLAPGQDDELLAVVDGWSADPDLASEMALRRKAMLADKVDLTAWYLDLIEELTHP